MSALRLLHKAAHLTAVTCRKYVSSPHGLDLHSRSDGATLRKLADVGIDEAGIHAPEHSRGRVVRLQHFLVGESVHALLVALNLETKAMQILGITQEVS